MKEKNEKNPSPISLRVVGLIYYLCIKYLAIPFLLLLIATFFLWKPDSLFNHIFCMSLSFLLFAVIYLVVALLLSLWRFRSEEYYVEYENLESDIEKGKKVFRGLLSINIPWP